MSNYTSYTELDVWKKARQLVFEIYKETARFPKEEMYGLTSQLRRAAISIPSNIAEGCGRQYKKETVQFQYMARGSQYEVETELYLAFDLSFITKEELDRILSLVMDCRKLLSGFINYLEKADLK